MPFKSELAKRLKCAALPCPGNARPRTARAVHTRGLSLSPNIFCVDCSRPGQRSVKSPEQTARGRTGFWGLSSVERPLLPRAELTRLTRGPRFQSVAKMSAVFRMRGEGILIPFTAVAKLRPKRHRYAGASHKGWGAGAVLGFFVLYNFLLYFFLLPICVSFHVKKQTALVPRLTQCTARGEWSRRLEGAAGAGGGEVGWSSAIVCRIAERFLPQQRVVVNVPSLVIRRHGKRPVKLKFPPARSKNLHTRNHVGRLGGGTMSDFKTKIWLGPFWLQSQSGGYMFSRLGMWKWAATVNRAGEWG